MKKFYKFLREQAMGIINFKNNNIKLLTNEEQNVKKQKFVTFVDKNFKINRLQIKNRQVRDHCNDTGEYRSAADIIYNLEYSVPKETPTVFYNGSNYDYCFIIKESAEVFEKQITCLGENTGIYITLSTLVQNKLQDLIRMEKKSQKKSYRLQFIDNARFMASSLSNLVNNLDKRIHKIKCKY